MYLWAEHFPPTADAFTCKAQKLKQPLLHKRRICNHNSWLPVLTPSSQALMAAPTFPWSDCHRRELKKEFSTFTLLALSWHS